MRVLVLGASGHIGGRIVSYLQQSGWAMPVAAVRKPLAVAQNGVECVDETTLADPQRLRDVLGQVGAIVTCHAEVTAQGTERLVEAARAVGGRRIVHLGSMAVYGRQEGLLNEDSPLDPELGWYARAMCKDETLFATYATEGYPVVILRLACVHGPGSEMWVRRIGQLLLAGRLGDIGRAGDGWANLIHVDDVCAATAAALRHAPASSTTPEVFNLAADDNPRWNAYFADLASRIGAVPLRYLSERQLKFDARFMSPFLKALEIVTRKLSRPSDDLPEALPPSLLQLWKQQIRLDVLASQRVLGVRYTPYMQSMGASADWFRRQM